MTPRHPIIIGFSGYMRSGKDTAGGYLRDRHGFHHASFAAKLKDALYALNPLIPRDTAGPGDFRLQPLVDAYGWEQAKDRFPEVRALLQRLGTDAGRKVLGENVWVDAVMRDMPVDRDVVFTDLRFPNEAQAIKDAGGVVVRIHRPGFEPGPDAHVSETALDGFAFDFEVTNEGSLDSFRLAIGFVLDMARSERQSATQAPSFGNPRP